MSTMGEILAEEEVKRLAAERETLQIQLDAVQSRMDEIDQILAGAHADVTPIKEEPPPSPCEHDWRILGAQDATPWTLMGKPTAHTAVLGRCTACGQPESWLLIGAWTLEDLTGDQP